MLPKRVNMLVQRVKTEFRFAIVLICGILASLIVLPFGIYRLVEGQVFIGVMDLLLAAAMTGIALHACTSKDSRRPGMLGAIVTTAWLAIMAGHTGQLALHWSHSVFLWNFYVAPRMLAAAANSVLALSLLLRPGLFSDGMGMASFGASALLINVIAGVVAWRGDRQRGQLRQLATEDALTGVGNRRRMELELAPLFAGSDAGAASHGIALLDLDHFKQVNDRAGHAAGDEVLRDFVRIVSRSARRFDRLYRLGGEEFVLLMALPDERSMELVLARVQQDVRAHLRQDQHRVTVSIGATMLCPGDSMASCLGRADRALYKAKGTGRDRTVVERTPSGPVALRAVGGMGM